MPPGAGTRRALTGLAALWRWRFVLGALLAGALPPVDLTPLVFVAFPGAALARRGQRRRLGLGPARLCLRRSAFSSPGCTGSRRRCLSISRASGGRCRSRCSACRPCWRCFPARWRWRALRLATRRLQPAPARRGSACSRCCGAPPNGLRGHVFTGLAVEPRRLCLVRRLSRARWRCCRATAWVGIYGLSFVTVLAAVAAGAARHPVAVADVDAARRAAPAIAAAAADPGSGGRRRAPARACRRPGRPTPGCGWCSRRSPQTLKWDPAAAEDNFHRLIELSARPPAHQPLAAVLWPEAAATFLLERDAAHRAAIAAVAPKGGYVITGAVRGDAAAAAARRRSGTASRRSTATATIRAGYDKAHLVPFGEYMPLRRSAADRRRSPPAAIDLSAGPGPQTIALPGLPPFAADRSATRRSFPARSSTSSDRPAWILNVTNDAWYGRSSGPYQHFAIARTRAVEEGLPLVRVANNGISGVVDPERPGPRAHHARRGRLCRCGACRPRAARTLYAVAGDWLFLALLLVGLVPVDLAPARRAVGSDTPICAMQVSGTVA